MANILAKNPLETSNLVFGHKYKPQIWEILECWMLKNEKFISIKGILGNLATPIKFLFYFYLTDIS